MPPLTKRQTEVLKVIARLMKKAGYPPSVDEVAAALSITKNGAHDHLLALQRAGRVDWTARKARTLRIL